MPTVSPVAAPTRWRWSPGSRGDQHPLGRLQPAPEDHHRPLPRPDRHARGRRRAGSREAVDDAELVGWIAQRGPPRAPGHLGVQRRVPAGRGRPARRHAARPRTGRRCAELARRLPRASTVDPDPIFVRDGDVWTSAGVTAGHGPRARARRGRPRPRTSRCEVARWLVLFLRRPGQPGAVQRPAAHAGRRPRTRSATCRRGSPTTPTPTSRVEALAERRAHEPAHTSPACSPTRSA